ncbi:hypothetical protein [Glutamicibacter sp. NPDC087583]|uniref:hypothetical protein n=1 Tax=Glutamicibacter sp. NPDC087583 TaxID=3363995 RepID=UPI0037F64B0B
MANTQIEFDNERLVCDVCDKETIHRVKYSVMKDASGRVVARLQQGKSCTSCGKNS